MANVLPNATATRVGELCATYLRAPESIATDATSGEPVLVFNPALTTAEQATLADLLRMARMGVPNTLSLAEFQAIKADLDTMRTFRQQTQAGFIALTQNQRDRALFDAINAQTNVLRALLRDG
jgi:hypothetical protein